MEVDIRNIVPEPASLPDSLAAYSRAEKNKRFFLKGDIFYQKTLPISLDTGHAL